MEANNITLMLDRDVLLSALKVATGIAGNTAFATVDAHSETLTLHISNTYKRCILHAILNDQDVTDENSCIGEWERKNILLLSVDRIYEVVKRCKDRFVLFSLTHDRIFLYDYSGKVLADFELVEAKSPPKTMDFIDAFEKSKVAVANMTFYDFIDAINALSVIDDVIALVITQSNTKISASLVSLEASVTIENYSNSRLEPDENASKNTPYGSSYIMSYYDIEMIKEFVNAVKPRPNIAYYGGFSLEMNIAKVLHVKKVEHNDVISLYLASRGDDMNEIVNSTIEETEKKRVAAETTSSPSTTSPSSALTTTITMTSTGMTERYDEEVLVV